MQFVAENIAMLIVAVIVIPVTVPALWDWKHRARLAGLIPGVLRFGRNGDDKAPPPTDEARWAKNDADHEAAFQRIGVLEKQGEKVLAKLDEIDSKLDDTRERLAHIEGRLE